MNSCEITAAISALGIAIAAQVSDEQLPLIAAVFTQLGDTLATISVQRELCKDTKSTKNSKCC